MDGAGVPVVLFHSLELNRQLLWSIVRDARTQSRRFRRLRWHTIRRNAGIISQGNVSSGLSRARDRVSRQAKYARPQTEVKCPRPDITESSLAADNAILYGKVPT